MKWSAPRDLVSLSIVTYSMGNVLVPPFISISLTLPSEAKTMLPTPSPPLPFVYLCFLAFTLVLLFCALGAGKIQNQVQSIECNDYYFFPTTAGPVYMESLASFKMVL